MRRGNREILLVRESTRSVCVDRKFSERKVLVRQYRFGYNVWFFIVKLAISIRHLSIVTFNNSAGDSEFLKNNEFDVRVYIYIYILHDIFPIYSVADIIFLFAILMKIWLPSIMSLSVLIYKTIVFY